jgi:hypothetical protein
MRGLTHSDSTLAVQSNVMAIALTFRHTGDARDSANAAREVMRTSMFLLTPKLNPGLSRSSMESPGVQIVLRTSISCRMCQVFSARNKLSW